MRLNVIKTYKLYVGGKFIRSESGYTIERHSKDGEFLGHACKGSRKDLRDAVKAARSAQAGWAGKTAYNRGQILYRIGEMLEARSEEFAELMHAESGASLEECLKEVETAVDRCVYYAGWTDKLDSVIGTVNPVAGPFFGFSVPEPTGVVGIVADPSTALIGMLSQVLPVISTGNTCVVLPADDYPLTASEFGEILSTSDVPGGVVNILGGVQEPLNPHLAKHMDVNAISLSNAAADTEDLYVSEGAENLKRIRSGEADWMQPDAHSLSEIQKFVETKSVWHPVEA
jgi:aldehyde dehydrogenase (NAD+)